MKNKDKENSYKMKMFNSKYEEIIWCLKHDVKPPSPDGKCSDGLKTIKDK